MSVAHSSSRACGDKIIAEQANSQLRTFFDELKNGTGNYRTIESLGKQIAQEYQGRCILELLQNAHDALANAKSGEPRLISFVLITTPEPTLLVGNSGSPFLKENFEGICQLGQSPKDPNESIGNKGVGFRSVLEISTCPEIWSTASSENAPAFAFRFHPDDFRERMTEAAEKLEEEGLEALSPFDPELQIIDWSQNGFEEYQKRQFDVVDEIEKLSPYQFPLPIDSAHYPEEVKKLLKEGCVTVIRLPLDGGMSEASKENAVQSVKAQLDELDARSTLFLSNLETLSIDIDGEQRTLKRKVVLDGEFLGCQRTQQQQLSIECSNKEPDGGSPRCFRVWTRSFGGKDNPQEEEKILDLVKHLPNRWPEVRQVTVGVAVEDTPMPDPGVFVIFLPTGELTGTGAHINAPFYGSIDRRHIEFDESYNELLRDFVSDLCLDVIKDLVSGKPEEWRAQAVIDILSSSAGEGVMNNLLVEWATERGCALKEQALILCDGGWCVSNKARLLDIPGGSPISASQWRECAQFSVVSSALDGREDAVKKLIEKLNDNGSPDPTDEEWKRTIEQMAENIQNQNIEVTWNDFMESVIAMLPRVFKQHSSSGNLDPLANMKFLPTESGRLLVSSGATKLFFRPVIGDDAAELAKKLPRSLEKHIAFLHQGIQTHEGSQHRNTEVQRFLDSRFVRSFGRKEILDVVVNHASPELPVSYEVPEDVAHHAEILAWTLKFLIVGVPENEILDLLKDLPVACYEGWRKMSEVMFGPGWTNNGDLVQSLVDELPEGRAEGLRKINLLPPDDPHWGVAKESIKDKEDLFKRAGVFDGLRLKEVGDVEFWTTGYPYKLPSSPPSGIPQEHWDDWRKNADIKEPPKSNFKYALSGIRLLPEIHCLSELSQPGRKTLSNLVLTSIGDWPDGWERVRIKKTSGGRYWSTDLISPLKHWLKVLPWFVDEDNDGTTLSQRWLVPACLRGQNRRFRHLDPLSKGLTKRLEEAPELKDVLKGLGLNVYPEEEGEKTGPELLEALANAWSDGKVEPQLFDVFLGQVRHAWQHFDAEKELPKRFLVRTGRQKFEVCERGDLSKVYLPDDKDRARTLLEHNQPVLVMKVKLQVPNDRRVANKLLHETAIKQASTLEEKFVIDGAPWRGEADEIPLLKTKYKWLPVPLLAIFAHGGTNPFGAETETWSQAANGLHGTRVLECEDITVRLVDEQEGIVAQSEPEAQWLKEDKVLAVRRDIGFSYKKLAPAVQAILGRQDLLSDLRCVLQSLDGKESPTQEEIDDAIKEVGIDAESLTDIRHRWTDDTDFLIERVKPVLWLFEVSTDELDEIEKDNQHLEEWLSDNFPQWPELFSEAWRCQDDQEMGKATWRKFGEGAQLPKWNAILERLGRELVKNDDEDEQTEVYIKQTEAHINEVKPLLRGFARHVAIQAENPDLFLEIEAISQNFPADKCWSEQWWEVPFEIVLKALCADYAKNLPNVERYLSAFEDVGKSEDLHAIFEKQGIGTEPNPYETYWQNVKQFDEMFSKLDVLYELWRENDRLKATPSVAFQAPEKLDAAAYLNDWQYAELFERSFAIIDDDQFRKACSGCASLEEIRKQLNLKPESVRDKLEERHKERRKSEDKKRQEEYRKNQTYTVAGTKFVDGEEDKVFEHIKSLPGPEVPHPDPDEFTPLKEIAGAGNGNSGGGGGWGGSYSPPSDVSRKRIGVVGEMRAFIYLQAMFKDAVTLDNWVSKNRLECRPLVRGEQDRTSDSLGYDFSFSHQGKRWHIEVKATVGDETQFELGATEIEAALRIAQRSSEPSEQWRVLRVRRALSEEPKFDWLPNPFKEGFDKYFRRSWSGMRVSYRLKNASSDE